MTNRKTFNGAAIRTEKELPWSVDNGNGTISLDVDSMIGDFRVADDMVGILDQYASCPTYFGAIERALEKNMSAFQDPEVRAMVARISIELEERRERMDEDTRLTVLTML
ncbi:MAG: hypothetical protein GC137_09250 [Alphaproteobacteria bacterium]|nr:hypothetical protein [Alphaproteobacteria bacterium]